MRLNNIYPRIAAVLLLLVALKLPAATDPAWTTPVPPFRIAANLYYVGSRDLAAYLIVTPAGDILLNSNLPSSPPLIQHSIEQLGFHLADVKILLLSHDHFDHAGGAASILKQTHAKYMVMDADVPTIESGGRTDFAQLPQFPPAHVDRILHDGDTVTLGGTTLVAHKTPGHTRGCTTWTLRVMEQGKPRDVVIVGSVTALDEYHLIDTPGHPAAYPGIAHDFAHTFDVLAALPCDIFLSSHGSYFDMLSKLARGKTEGPSVWIDPAGYKRAVSQSRSAFEADLAHQQAKTRAQDSESRAQKTTSPLP